MTSLQFQSPASCDVAKGSEESPEPSASAIGTLVRVFNKFLIDMVIDVKSQNPALKRALKQLHKAIDPASHDYIKHALASLSARDGVTKDALVRFDSAERRTAELLRSESVMPYEPLPGISVGLITEGLPDASLEAVQGYLYVLSALALTYAESPEDGAAAAGDTLARNVLHALSRMQAGESADGWTDCILDDDIVALLERVPMATLSGDAGAGNECGAEEVRQQQQQSGLPDLDDVLKKMENSKIADLAKEISSEIDVSQLPTDNPMDMLNFANLTDSNSLLGNIVSKVGNKIQTRLANGEMKQDELLSEAVTLLKAFDTQNKFTNNPMFSELFKAAQSGKVNLNSGAVRSMSARERLRRKMEKQRAAAAASGV
jgi:hypothetical protein